MGSSSKISTHDKKRKARSSDLPHSSKKSKTTSSSSDDATINIDGRTSTGPVIVSCPDFDVAPETPFTLYTAPPLQDEDGNEDAEAHEQTLLVGEDDVMRYVSNNGDWTTFAGEERGMSRVREYDGEYMLGVYDPDTKTVTLRRAPLLSLRRSVRAHEDLNPMASGANDYATRQLQRRHLGDLFGNRKMKAKASNADRMKVEGSSDSMQRILTQVTSGIESAKKDQIQESNPAATTDTSHAEAIEGGVPPEVLRFIPMPNLKAEHPEEVYPIETLVPLEVLRALKIDWAETAENAGYVSRFLPFPAPAKSQYMPHRVLETIKAHKLNATQKSEDRVRLAVYGSLLWGFLFSERCLNNRKDLTRRLKLNDPAGGSTVINYLYLSFSEAQRGSKQRTLTTFMKTKVLAYLMAILLHLDAFAIDFGSLSTELELTAKRLADIFQSLGCRSATVTSSTDSRKIAKKVLRLPLSWPKPSRR